jgi:hypothetical protein
VSWISKRRWEGWLVALTFFNFSFFLFNV